MRRKRKIYIANINLRTVTGNRVKFKERIPATTKTIARRKLRKKYLPIEIGRIR